MAVNFAPSCIPSEPLLTRHYEIVILMIAQFVAHILLFPHRTQPIYNVPACSIEAFQVPVRSRCFLGNDVLTAHLILLWARCPDLTLARRELQTLN